MRALNGVRIGVDLGGTKTEAVAVDIGDSPNDGRPVELARQRVPTRRDEGYDHILALVVDLVRAVAKEANLTTLPKIGIGLPGSTTAKGLVKNANTTALNGRPFCRDLEAKLEAPIAFANDANCFALAEATWGAARGARVAFGVIMGTGVGGGLVFDGRAWNGASGIAGEWGHVVLDPVNGLPCYCGRRGCIETYLSGPAIEAAWEARAGHRIPLDELAKTPEAKGFLTERMEIFGRALATVIDIVDPDIVVLGGGVSNLEVLYTDGVSSVARWVFDDHLETRIVRNILGDSAGVLGAALLPV